MNTQLPPLPHSWSELTWQQLCDCWSVKMRYGGNADVARVAALLSLTLGSRFFDERSGKAERKVQGSKVDERSGETVYTIVGQDGQLWTTTPRELTWMAKQTMPWFDFPYGDQGDKEETDDDGHVIKEQRDGKIGYVCQEWKDAMPLPLETIKIGRRHYALPSVACSNITWQQYRALQSIAPSLFQENISEEQATLLQAQFLAHSLVRRSLALLDNSGRTIKVRPHYVYEYDADQTEGQVKYWQQHLKKKEVLVLFHVCFQVYQTALTYYAKSYPALFSDSGKNDPLRDALTGEVGTINTIMKYAGYSEQQQVYDSNLPFVLDILNTMTKEAQEIEKMKSKVKK